MAFEDNRLLYGHDPEPRLVAVELSDSGEMAIFTRSPSGELLRRDEPYRPFLWTAGSAQVSGVEYHTLKGDLALGFLAECDSWETFATLRTELKQLGMPHHAATEPAHQWLLATGKTLFKGLPYSELRRLQIHALQGGEGEITRIDLADAQGWSLSLGPEEGGERGMLGRLSEVIAERDPDVIEGHDLFRGTLDLIHRRARRVRLKLPWGRNGAPLSSRSSRLQIAEKTIGYPKFTVWGRHLVDSYVLAMQWDVSARELEGTSLEEVAAHFRLEGEPVAQICALVELLGAAEFIQAQLFPYPYQEQVLRGRATKIDALFLREYLRERHSIPLPPETRSFEGGYTDIFYTGVAHNVLHCDVTSLYPSVMLRFDCFPEADRLGIFRHLLTDLRQFRYEAKAGLRAAVERGDASGQDHYGALQQAFKILINSFYGYLGFAQGHFADFDAASRVTGIGRDLLRQMVAWLKGEGAEIIEIDTDGIYFTPPANATAEALHAGLSRELPEGIEVEMDAHYPAMFSYKAKNYALLTDNGDLLLKGGALRSRGLERFQRQMIEETLRALLEGRPEHFRATLQEYEEKISEGQWPIEMLMKTDSLQDSLARYRQKIEAGGRNRSAPYELALQSGHDYQPGDQISYYITGTKKTVVAYENCRLASDWDPNARDENVKYYLGKLKELAKRFEGFFDDQGK